MSRNSGRAGRGRRVRPGAGNGGRGVALAVALAAALLGQPAGSALATPPATAGVAPTRLPGTRVVPLGTSSRRYRLHVPSAAARGTPLPLVVAFHGAGSTAAMQERASGLSALAERAGFVVVYPEGRGRRWAADAADERFVREVVADVARQLPIDPRRVYATGISNGGLMTAHAACTMDDLFAAVATVASVYRADSLCRPARPVPVLAFHGLADRRAPYAPVRGWTAGWAMRNGCAAEPAVEPGEGVSTRRWSGCEGGGDVVLATVAELGHGWPNDPSDPGESRSPVDASGAIWRFFLEHPMPVGR